MSYLPKGLPSPVAENDGVDKPYWDGTRRGELMVQRCTKCDTFRWGPEWICHSCLSFDSDWQKVSGKGRIYSWERPWHPVHPALMGPTSSCWSSCRMPATSVCSATCWATPNRR
jgi:hypothetical protein